MKLTSYGSLVSLAASVMVACGAVSEVAALPDLALPSSPTSVPTVIAPNQTPTITPTPTPALQRLTEPGCCTQPMWSADSAQIRFIDRPSSLQPVGLYGVGLGGEAPALISERLGQFSPNDEYIAYPEGGQTYVEEVGTGQRWTIDNGGRRVFFSPSSARLVWTEVLPGGGGFDRRSIQYQVTSVLGEPVGEPFALYGGGYSGWLDDDHLLVAGKTELDGERALYSAAVADGALVELARGERVRSGIPSPGGAWVAYLVLFDEEEPERNGFWMVSADGQTHYQLDLFGAVQWRDSDHLLMVPQEMGAPSHRLVEIDARTGQVTPLTDPAVTPFTIEGGDWQISPDGQHVVFLSAADRDLWLLRLP
jgi:hypothetical protein